MPHLGETDLDIVRAGVCEPGWPIAVLGPGTGLGVAALVPVGDGWRPIASEGGHASFAPHSEREDAILRELRKEWPHVSCERVLSGPGLLLGFAVTGQDLVDWIFVCVDFAGYLALRWVFRWNCPRHTN